MKVKLKKMMLSKPVLAILLLISSLAIAAVTSSVMTQNIAAPQGATGPKGDTGPMGPQGPKGETGLTGAIGANGLAGPIGETGAAGAAGATGATGATGPAGTNGLSGATILNGTGVPASDLGVNGDYYLNTANDDFYSKVSGTWTVVTNIKGSTGATGATGAIGATGAAGATGSMGPTGPAGSGVTIIYNDTYAQSSVPLTVDYKTVANTSFTATSNGYVVVNVNAMAMLQGNTLEAIGIGTTANAYPNLCRTFAGTTNTEDTTTYYPITLQTTVPVTEGAYYNFCTNAYLLTALNPTDLYYIYMTAIFYPTQ